MSGYDALGPLDHWTLGSNCETLVKFRVKKGGMYYNVVTVDERVWSYTVVESIGAPAGMALEVAQAWARFLAFVEDNNLVEKHD